MLIIYIGIGIALLLMFGAGLALLGGDREVEERLEQFVGPYEPELVSVEGVEEEPPDLAERLDNILQQRPFFEPIRQRIAMADVKLRVSEYITLQLLAAFGLAAVAYYIFDLSVLIVIVLFLVGLRLPRIYVSFMARRRMKAFNDQLGDCLNLWVNALRSGYSPLQGMEAIATELPPPISSEFERVVQEIRLGLSLEQALNNMLRRVPSEDLDLVITAINIQREVGGNLAEILDIISHTIRERVRIKGEIQTLTAQGRLTGWVVSLLPIGLALVLYSINPAYGAELFVRESPFIIPGVLPCGWVVVALGVLMMGVGILAVTKIVDIEV